MSPVRSKAHDRCKRCFMRQVLCICPLAPTLALRTRVSVLMHWREQDRTSNTGRIAALALPNSEVLVWGDCARPIAAEDWESPGMQPLLLFPGPGSRELTPELVAGFDLPVRLWVPDGSWRQGRKIANREKALASVPRVRLPDGAPTAYRLRKSPHEGNISTLEAIARALEIIEPGESGEPVASGRAARKALESLFEVMVERTLWSRGRLRMADCRFGIPPAALDAFREAGCRSKPALSSPEVPRKQRM